MERRNAMRDAMLPGRAALSSAVRVASRPRIKIQVKAPASAAARRAQATLKSM